MEFPIQLVVFTAPSVLYMVVRRFRAAGWKDIFSKLGWSAGKPRDYLLSLAVTALTGVFGWLAFQFIPAYVLEDPNINLSGYAGYSLSPASFVIILLREGFYIALGEEIFFRGLLGGWLIRRLGFVAGNTLQAVIFLLPHLLLLWVSLRLWPILIVQAIAGWLMGWLRHRSGSILPGWLAHTLINTLSALSTLR